MCKKEDENEKVRELELYDLEKVTGGGAFDDVPRVPEKMIDESLKQKI